MVRRQPIVSVLGHVDHGKTTLLDAIRGTTVTAKEPGLITQHVGASEIPLKVIKKICGSLLDKIKTEIKVPGLLFIDTPGHEAFTTIRKRGSSIADLAILVVDVNEGFKPQTDEALGFLREFKTPFVIAATKIDKIQGWVIHKNACFIDSYREQPDNVKSILEQKLYELVGQLSERGFNSERFDRVTDFRKEVAIVPCSGITGEGVPELLMVLIGLAQTFLKDELEIKSDIGKGSILEVKEVKGLGTTIDIILYDGKIRKGDYLIIGGKKPTVTKIRALLKPKPLRELRVEKEFESIDEVTAASGIKISAPGLEGVLAGSPIRAVRSESDIEEVKKELQQEIEMLEFEKNEDGVSIRADTLGSLEALIYMMKQRGIPIKRAEVGSPTRKDIAALEIIDDPLKKVMLIFNVQVPDDIKREASDKRIKIIAENVIYRLFEEYDRWIEETKEEIKRQKLSEINWPGRLKVLPGFVFRQSKPAIVGVEVLEGKIRTGVRLRKQGKEIGTIRDIQSEGQHVDEAVAGQRVAISIEGGVVGRNFNEGDELTTVIFKRDLEVLEEFNMPEAGLARKILDV